MGDPEAALLRCTSSVQICASHFIADTSNSLHGWQESNICDIQKAWREVFKAPDVRPNDVRDDAEEGRSFTSTGCGTGGVAKGPVGRRPVRVWAMIRGRRSRIMCRCM